MGATEQEESPEMGGFTMKFGTSVVSLPEKETHARHKPICGVNPFPCVDAKVPFAAFFWINSIYGENVVLYRYHLWSRIQER